jgi:tRNA1(Val) A37 N6-methylase TrmN6
MSEQNEQHQHQLSRSTSNHDAKEQITNVIYTLKRNAKQVKTILEQHDSLNKSFRLTKVNPTFFTTTATTTTAAAAAAAAATTTTTTSSFLSEISSHTTTTTGKNQDNDLIAKCIAIPVYHSGIYNLQGLKHESSSDDHKTSWLFQLQSFIIGAGEQPCLYSSSTLGNTTKSNISLLKQQQQQQQQQQQNKKDDPVVFTAGTQINITQQILIETIQQLFSLQRKQHQLLKTKECAVCKANNVFSNTQTGTLKNGDNDDNVNTQLESLYDTCTTSLNSITCPNKLEIMGDDRTVVLPFKALNENLDEFFSQFVREILSSISSFFSSCGLCHDNLNNNNDDDEYVNMKQQQLKQTFYDLLWSNVGKYFRSPRVVRRGEIDRDSKIRHSGHKLLWMMDKDISNDKRKTISISDTGNINSDSSNSNGWITITEQRIKQSFDLTKVMFSRGNISEKIRFGKLVQENDVVLDMYAGIGYYTLPALVYGKAKHVYSCEWNNDAIFALKYNLQQNKVHDRATIIEGDSRMRLMEDPFRDIQMDRISLGLLPSSEGGWRTAIRMLNKDKGGWLHIHGNVPVNEKQKWCFWACLKLYKMYREIHGGDDITSIGRGSPFILCNHLERVKSFAPKVDHLVADIYVGHNPPHEFSEASMANLQGCKIGLFDLLGEFHSIPDSDGEIEAPSCALESGVLNQEWMVDIK